MFEPLSEDEKRELMARLDRLGSDRIRALLRDALDAIELIPTLFEDGASGDGPAGMNRFVYSHVSEHDSLQRWMLERLRSGDEGSRSDPEADSFR
jgi:hypothetical protein